MVLLELWLGYELKARIDALQAATLKAWIEGVEAAYAGRTLPFSARGARLCAPLHVPNPRALRDSVIAATALEHGMTLVTRNVHDFVGTGVRLVDPFA